MSSRETPRRRGAASNSSVGLGRTRRTAICASIATAALAAFPALASAITSTPLLTGVSATPSSGGASLNATIYPYGLDTHYRFEYGPTAIYGTSIPVPDADVGSAAYPGTVPVTQAVTGLTSNTTYHYRIVASNSMGAATGPEAGDKTFTTTGPAPTVVADAATATGGGFELSGTVNPHGGGTTFRFEYGTTTAYGNKIPVPDGNAGSGTSAVPVSEEVLNTALLPNTTYHFRLVAQNGGGSVPSPDQTFTTPPSPPAAPAAVVSAPVETAGGYMLKGAINPNSVDTHYHFEFGTTTAYGTNLPEPDADVGSGSSAVAVSQEVTGLAPNTTYHYRIVASNSKGPGTSLDQAFTTPPEPPVAVATPYSETAGSFSLNGTVNPNGGDTTYRFEFGITAAYGSKIPASEADVGQGNSPVSVSQSVGGLPPNVPYHYRLVAKNAGGTTMSNDEEFITPPVAAPVVPEPPAFLPPPPPSPATNQFTVGAAVAKGATATLQVGVPGPGTVSASGKQLKPATVGSSGAGTVVLKLKLTGAGLKALKTAKKHRLTVKVKVVFQPTGGSPGTTSRTVTFKK
jgi:hypothetical protein